ncbi:MAG: hypothetical protein J7K77_04340, partial [Dehalococcoidales bacterium]|nr:hypothetical protein [Dehalococcoidales bacterium]
WARVWTDLDIASSPDVHGANKSFDVLTVNCSPFFNDDTQVDVVVTDNNPYTAVLNNIGGVRTWNEVAELKLAPAATTFQSVASSDIQYVSDFDSEYDMYVGVTEVTTAGLGDVFNICGSGCQLDLGVNDDIVSLSLVGSSGATSMVAGGTAVAGPAPVYYSTDNGDSWDAADKPPTGLGAVDNLVIAADDFADTGTAWCVSQAAGTDGAVSLTTDFGKSWNQISMIDAEMDAAVWDTAFSPDYGSVAGAPMFIITTDSFNLLTSPSVWRYDGTYWERIWLDVATAAGLDIIEVSPGFATDGAIFVADSATPEVLYSHDSGATFTAMTKNPAVPGGAARPITAWVVVDDETVITGAATGEVYKTTRYGRRCWDETVTTGMGAVTDIALSPAYDLDGSVLVGDAGSRVWLSTDGADSFEELSGTDGGDLAALVTGLNWTYVAFDPAYSSNKTLYAASDDVVGQCVIDAAKDIPDQEIKDMGALITTAGDIAVSNDGIQAGNHCSTLYALDIVAGGGLYRTLNPTDAVADVVFENVAAGMGGAVTLTLNLRLTGGSNNVLYSIDTTAVLTDIWTYTDTLAKPVTLDKPADGSGLDDTTRVSFGWDDLNADTVVQYQIWVNEESDFPAATDEAVGTIFPDLVTDNAVTWRAATAGTTYYWKVRVATAQPYLSRWSEAWSFTTKLGQVAAPVQVRPAPGAQDVITKPTFDWQAVPGANGYEVQVCTNDMFLLTDFVAQGTSSINAWAIDTELDYDTPYYWRVRGLKDGAPVGDWVVSIFRTMEEPAAPQPPVVIEQTPPAPAPVVNIPPTQQIAPKWIYAIVGIGAALAIVVIVLIVRTRKTP